MILLNGELFYHNISLGLSRTTKKKKPYSLFHRSVVLFFVRAGFVLVDSVRQSLHITAILLPLLSLQRDKSPSPRGARVRDEVGGREKEVQRVE